MLIFKGLLLLSFVFVAILAKSHRFESQIKEVDRIVGGSPATKSQSKFVVLFQWVSDKSFFCSGTLLKPNKVLTTAHCANRMIGYWVNMIVNTLTTKPDIDAAIRGPTTISIHPQYDSISKMNDLAMITLSTSVNYPGIAIDYLGNLNSATATAFGWGYNQAPGVQNLTSALVTIVPPTTCATYYNNTNYGNGNYSTCLQASGVASCTTDVGGPILSANGSLFAVNHVFDCGAGKPFAAVRLTNYQSWITSLI